MPIKDFSCSPANFYLITSFLYCENDGNKDTKCTLGIASTRSKANELIDSWAKHLKEDGYKFLKEMEPHNSFRTFKATDELDDNWDIDFLISEVKVDQLI